MEGISKFISFPEKVKLSNDIIDILENLRPKDVDRKYFKL